MQSFPTSPLSISKTSLVRELKISLLFDLLLSVRGIESGAPLVLLTSERRMTFLRLLDLK